MSISARIRSFQLLVGLAIIVMAFTSLVGIRSATDAIDRTRISRQQLDAVTQLAISANRFSEQIAELLLIGEPERSDFLSARNQTNTAFDALRQLLRLERDLLSSDEEIARAEVEGERIDRMQALFREIDRAVERVLLLDQQGQRAEAIALFRSEIENRLDAEFEKLIADTVSDEREEVNRVQAEAQGLSERMELATIALSALLIVVVIGSGVLFARSLRVPINALAEGAQAIERGQLDHRIAYDRRDEFGLLATRFNAMAAEIQIQRRALLDARSDLERQVEERTREIAAANRQLTELDAQRARFIADVSHELRTPLTILRGEAEVTLRDPTKTEETYRAALSRIVEQAAAMGRLIEDLLFLGRSEADEIRFEYRRVALADIVAEAVDEARSLARERQTIFEIEPSPENIVVRADPRRLKQALLIVLDNAARYGGACSPVAVQLGRAEGNVQITVRDHGPGFHPDELDRVFERFYRGASARAESGSGLGLPIARWIVEKHRGQINLRNADGGGAEARILLPGE
jgi:signal transduction histidine kinase